jgi:transaldolase
MNNSYFHRVQAQTQTRFWINNVTREETSLAIQAGAVGCTQNPSFPFKMLCANDENEKNYVYGLLDQILIEQNNDNDVQIHLQRALVEKIAKTFQEMYEQSGGTQGFVSIQGDPLREDADTIIKYGLFNHIAPNIMIKIPVTKEGLEAIGELAAKGLPINATEVMSVRQALDVASVYEKATRGMKQKPAIFYSHITGIFDEYLQNYVRDHNIAVNGDALWQAGIVVAKKTYQMVNDLGIRIGFIGGGARGLHHFTEMVGANAVVTINWKDTAEELILQNPPVVQRFFQPTPPSVVEELCEKLPDFVKSYFAYAIEPEEYDKFGPVVLFRSMFEGAWNKANELIAQRRKTSFL